MRKKEELLDQIEKFKAAPRYGEINSLQEVQDLLAKIQKETKAKIQELCKLIRNTSFSPSPPPATLA